MSEPTSKFERFGFDQDPFDTRIAAEDIAERYDIVGREEQEHQLWEFVEDGVRTPSQMKTRLIFGEYGTGKSHHLIQLRNKIDAGVEIDGTQYESIAVYVGNLGLSIRRLYEKILEEIERFAPEMGDAIDSLADVEPDDSVDEQYQFERLQDNITDNLRRVAKQAREDFDYRALFIFIDEAEDIANESEDKVQPFIRSFLHLVNNLQASGIHLLLGFSQGARMRITSYEDDEDTLGNALMQRFQGGEIYLGDLRAEEVSEMLINRMDQHRSTNVGEITPIVSETVDVVTDLTGGHPREILALYSEALNYAEELGHDRIDGDAVVHALVGFDSFTRDEQLIGQQELVNLYQGLESAHKDARDDFELLQGRLIGESEAVPEDAFSESVPGTLLSPVTIEGEETIELRVLEQREEHGKYFYVISEAAQDYLFGSGGGGGTEIQKLDFQASSAQEKFQQEMSRGLGIALQAAGKGSLHKSPVTERHDRHEFGLYLINIKREPGKNDQTIAVGVSNSQEIPEEIVRLYVEAIKNDQASFGVLVKQNQQLSAEANRYLKEIDELSRRFFEERVIEIDLSTEDRDEFVYGRLLALGDTDSDADEDVDEAKLIDELEIFPALTEKIDLSVLPYPEERYRRVINYLRENNSRSFTIGDIRDALDLQDYDINQDIMDGLRAQSLVAKDGRRWTFPDLESDRPPWYELYHELNEDGPLTLTELQERISREKVLDCPPGDENAMFQWYLDHLQMEEYVEATEVTRDGGTVDAYQVVSVTDQFNQAIQTAKDRLDSAEELVKEAASLSVEDLQTYRNRTDDFDRRLEDLQEIFEPEHSDLTDTRSLIDDISDLEGSVESGISDRQDTIEGEASDLKKIKIGDLRERIDQKGEEGSFAERLQDIDGTLAQYQEELRELIESEEYVRLSSRIGSIRNEVRGLESEVEDILEARGLCVDLYEELLDTKSDIEESIGSISSQNPARSELTDDLDVVDSNLEEYREFYNNNDYDEALSVLQEDVEPLLSELDNDARQIADEERRYRGRLNGLESEIESIDDADDGQKAGDILEAAFENVDRGNFADLPAQISDIQNLLEGPTREELFESALKKHDGSLTAILEEGDFDEPESFELLERFYGDSIEGVEIEDVKAVITGE